MKKLFLLFVAMCCTMMSWGDYAPVSDNPYAQYSKLTNLQIDSACTTLTFTDTYLPTVPMAERFYEVFFYAVGDSTSWYYDAATGYASYGTSSKATQLRIADASNYYTNSTGGFVAITIRSQINQLLAMGVRQFMVAVQCRYRLSETDEFTYYSCSQSLPPSRFLSNVAFFDVADFNFHKVDFYYQPNVSIDKYWTPKLYKSYLVRDSSTIASMYSVPDEFPSDVEFTPFGWYDLDLDDDDPAFSGPNRGANQLTTISSDYRITEDQRYMLAQNSVRLQIYANDIHNGYIKSARNGIVTNGNVTDIVSYGTVISVEAVPAQGYYFRGWSDGEKSQTRKIVVHHELYIEADFGDPLPYPVFVAGLPVTQANEDDILGDGGSMQYNPDNQTLYLMSDSLTIDGSNAPAIKFVGAGLQNPQFTMYVWGDGCVIQSNSKGIYLDEVNLDIVTKKNLRVESGDVAIYGAGNVAVNGAGKLELSGDKGAVRLQINEFIVYKTFVDMSTNTGSTCSGISDLYLIGCSITSGQTFSSEKKGIVDANGQLTSSKVTIGPAVSALHEVSTSAAGTTKRIENGQLLIIRDGRTFNAQGALVR